MVRNCSEGAVTSRTGRRLRCRSVISPTSLSGRARGVLENSSRVVVVELFLCLLGQESLKFCAKLVSAGQILVVRQQRSIFLSVDEGIVLALERGHHLSHLGACLDLLVDPGTDLRRCFGQRRQR